MTAAPMTSDSVIGDGLHDLPDEHLGAAVHIRG